MSKEENIIEFSSVAKNFPGVKALQDITFTIKKGEVHALVGENGAGKSTLLNILHGVYSAYEGQVLFDGKPNAYKTTHDAISDGIAKVHQEVSLIPDMSIGQNILLGYEPRNKMGLIQFPELHKEAQALLDRMKCRMNSRDIVGNISVGEMQMIAIAKALFHNARVISFDEPTASLSQNESDILFSVIDDLKQRGITTLYVSHRLEEIFEIADRVTVLRDGTYIGTYDVADINRNFIIKKMVGRDVSAFAQRVSDRIESDEVVMEVKDFSSDELFRNISFSLKKGEILGFFGLVGAKRTDVARAIFGADAKDSGRLFISGKEVIIKSPRDALFSGIGLIPENRKTEGLIKNLTNEDNIGITCMERFTNHGFIKHKLKRENCQYYIDKLNLSPADPTYITESLSGGNQQKVILARWLSTEADILILDEPTKGIDVGAKAEIYLLLEELVHQGKSIIIISSELPEIIGICDRVVVMQEGKKITELPHQEFTEEKILHFAMGGTEE